MVVHAVGSNPVATFLLFVSMFDSSLSASAIPSPPFYPSFPAITSNIIHGKQPLRSLPGLLYDVLYWTLASSARMASMVAL